MHPKLVKNTKIIKLPCAKNTVRSIARTALMKADRQSWDKIIIIGQGKEFGSWYSSAISDHELVGILECIKNDILNN